MTINPSESEAERIKKTFLENPWSNAYWFARMFINSDKYGSIGKENKLLAEIAIGLRSIAEDKNSDDKYFFVWAMAFFVVVAFGLIAFWGFMFFVANAIVECLK